MLARHLDLDATGYLDLARDCLIGAPNEAVIDGVLVLDAMTRGGTVAPRALVAEKPLAEKSARARKHEMHRTETSCSSYCLVCHSPHLVIVCRLHIGKKCLERMDSPGFSVYTVVVAAFALSVQ